jgi:hypothetical protein
VQDDTLAKTIKRKDRTLVTNNCYSSGSLVACNPSDRQLVLQWILDGGHIKELGMRTFIATINLTSKKYRTTDDFPIHKCLQEEH